MKKLFVFEVNPETKSRALMKISELESNVTEKEINKSVNKIRRLKKNKGKIIEYEVVEAV